MGDRYLTDLADVLAGAGLDVLEVDGWATRARSSGGYDGAPVAVFWHHTASSGDGLADAVYCAFGDPDAPVCNLVVGPDAVVYVIAAGASNTNGKGGPLTLPSGTVIPTDGANARVIGMEISNNGVGMTYPADQVDAALRASRAMAAAYGFAAADVAQHADWCGPGTTQPGRKIDPATAAAVAGPWQPAAVNASGSWSLADLRAELTGPPPPTPDPIGDDVMRVFLVPGDTSRAPMLLGPGWRRWARSQEEADVMLRCYGPAVEVDARNYDVVASICAAPSDGWP